MEKEKNKKIEKHSKIIIIVIIITLLLDQITKIVAYMQGYNTLPNVNTEESGYYIVMSVILIILIIRYISNDNSFIKLDTKIILSFAISGVAGNLIDRIWFKNTIVFISLGNGINMNFAYLYILIAWIGMAAILTKNTMKMLKDKNNKKVIKNEYEKDKNKRK